MIRVNPSLCPQDHRCPMIRLCPQQAIKQDGVKAPMVDTSLCIECLVCVKKCPHKAFEKI